MSFTNICFSVLKSSVYGKCHDNIRFGTFIMKLCLHVFNVWSYDSSNLDSHRPIDECGKAGAGTEG